MFSESMRLRVFTVALLAGMAVAAPPLCAWILRSVGQPLRQAPGHAMVSVERTRHDFGRVTAGVTLTATFRVRNPGGRRLILLEKSRSCGCLTGGRPELLVGPGRSIDLNIELDTKRLRGRVEKAVRYRTNDPDRPTLTLWLAADVDRSKALTES